MADLTRPNPDLGAFSAAQREPQSVTAARLALLIMKHLEVSRWEQVTPHPLRETILLTDTQHQLLVDHAWVLPLLQWKPIQWLAICDGCDGYMLMNEAAMKPSKCMLTHGCDGTLHSSKVANNREARFDQRGSALGE